MPNLLVIRTIAGALLFAFGSAGLHAQIAISVGDTTGRKGDTLLIPISVSSLSVSDSVYSGSMDVWFNTGVLEVIGIESAGTVSAGVSIFYNTTTRKLAFADDAIITGSGVFVHLKARVKDQPSKDTTQVTLSNVLLNEGSPVPTVTKGVFRVLTIAVSPKTPPSIVVVGSEVQFSVSGDQIPPLTWTLSHPAVGTIGSDGKFTALAPGQTKIHVEDSRGLQDSTNLFPIYPASASSLTISVPDTSYTQTLHFNLPVRVSDVTGLGIVSAQWVMTFSSTRLQATDVVLEGTMTEGWSPSFEVSSGRIEIALAGANALEGSGVLAYVRFRVLPSASGASTVSFSDVLFNEDLTASTQSGTFTPSAAPTVVVFPNTAHVVRQESLQFSVTSGGTPPYQWSSSDSSVATIDPVSGLLTALNRGTTTVSVTDNLGFVGTSGSITVNDVEVSVPDTGVWIADSVDVPIFVDDVTGLEIYSFELRLAYDSLVAKFVSVVEDGGLAESFTIVANDTLDTLRIVAAGTTALAGEGPLIRLRFKANALPPSSAPLDLIQFVFNEAGPETPTARLSGGSITIFDAAGIPMLVSPADGAANIPVPAPLVWNSSVAATSYRVQIATDAGFTTITVDSSGIADTTAGFAGLGSATTYYWRVSGVNGGGGSAFSPGRSFTTTTVVSVEQIGSGVPDRFDLMQNFPNPFNPSTNIRFALPEESDVRLTVFDIAGTQVGTVYAGRLQAGTHQVPFAASGLPSGVYFFRLEAFPRMAERQQSFVRTMKMVLVK